MLKLPRLGLLIAVTVMLALVLGALNLPFLGRDFISFWTGAQAIRTGHSPYDQAFQTAVQQANGWDAQIELFPFHPYVYPPWLALLIWPLAWLPYRAAFAVWLAVSLVLGAVAVRLLMSTLRPRGGRYALPLAWLMALTYLPVLHGVVVGQTHLVLLYLMAVVMWAGAASRDRAAGLALGLMSIKPQVGLVLALLFGLYWLAQRRWPALFSLILTGAACAALSFMVAPDWVTDMLAAPDRFTALTGLPLLPSGFRDYPTVYAAARVGLEQDPALLCAVSLGVFGALLLIARRIRDVFRQPVWFSVIVCAGLCVITPYARVYELTLLVWPALFLAWSPRARWPRPLKVIVVTAIYAWPWLLLPVNAAGVWNVVAPLALLWALLLAEGQSHATLAEILDTSNS
jgi:hypothetical protein